MYMKTRLNALGTVRAKRPQSGGFTPSQHRRTSPLPTHSGMRGTISWRIKCS